MTQNNWRIQDEICADSVSVVVVCLESSVGFVTSDATSLPVVHITSTDAGLSYMHANIPRIFQRWNCAVFKDHVFDGT